MQSSYTKISISEYLLIPLCSNHGTEIPLDCPSKDDDHSILRSKFIKHRIAEPSLCFDLNNQKVTTENFFYENDLLYTLVKIKYPDHIEVPF